MWRGLLVSAACCVLPAMVGSPAAAENPLAADEIVCPRVERGPVVDGKLDDACWESTRLATLAEELREAPADESVGFRACFDGKGLYLGLLCEAAGGGRARRSGTTGSTSGSVSVAIRRGSIALRSSRTEVNWRPGRAWDV